MNTNERTERGKEGGGEAQGREKVPGFSDSCSFGLLRSICGHYSSLRLDEMQRSTSEEH